MKTFEKQCIYCRSTFKIVTNLICNPQFYCPQFKGFQICGNPIFFTLRGKTITKHEKMWNFSGNLDIFFFSFSFVFNLLFQLEMYESCFFIALVARNYCFTIRKNVEWLVAPKRSGRLISRNLTWLPFFLKVPRGLNRLNLIKNKREE